MNRTTTLLLFLLVALLGFAVWKQREVGANDPDLNTREALFEGVIPGRITSIFFDNVARDFMLRFERDQIGQWLITEPVAYPAAEEQVQRMLETITTNVATRVPDAELQLAESSLEDPRVAFEVTETLEDGSKKITRVEVGDLDLDGNRVFVRTRGKVFRTLRNFDSMLQLNLADYRSHRIFTIRPREIVEVLRDGSALLGSGPRNLFMRVRRHGLGWRMERPHSALIDPTFMGFFLAKSTSLAVDKFVEDDPQDLALYGLDNPQVRLEFVDNNGNSQAALFAQAQVGGDMYCKRETLPHVWIIPRDFAVTLMQVELELVDHNFLRAFRDDVERIELGGASGTLVLTRDATRETQPWTVASRSTSAAPGAPRPASAEFVADILTRLDALQVARYLPEEDAAAIFPKDAPWRGIRVTAGGQVQGGSIADGYTSAQGSQAVYFLRDEDSIVGLLPSEVTTLFDLTLLDLVDPQLLVLEEKDQRTLTVSGGGKTREFKRQRSGEWFYTDMNAQATELWPVLDGIFFLRAEEHIEDGTLLELSDPVEVSVVDAEGVAKSFTLARDAGGATYATVDGHVARLADQELHGRLLEIATR